MINVLSMKIEVAVRSDRADIDRADRLTGGRIA
jgi:hypothetical protein